MTQFAATTSFETVSHSGPRAGYSPEQEGKEIDGVNTTPLLASPILDESRLDNPVPPEPCLTEPRQYGCYDCWWRRVGLSGLLVLVIGTLIILVSMAILVFLWSGAKAAEHRNEPVFWKTIVIKGWAPRVVTIFSAAVRTSIALQVGLVVAAASAIMLETSGALMTDMPMLSISRALKGSPLDTIPAALRRYTAGDLLGLAHLIIPVTALIIVFGTTFMSTILLSDFRTGLVAELAITETVPVDGNLFSNAASYWRSRPSTQWRIAESKTNRSLGPTSDTGNTYRAMLPFVHAKSRDSLEYYSGPAQVANFRTSCIAPDIRNISFNFNRNWDYTYVSLTTSQAMTIFGNDYSPSLERPVTTARLIETLPPSSSDNWPLSLSYDEMLFYRTNDSEDSELLFLQRVFLFNSSRLLAETILPVKSAVQDLVESAGQGLDDKQNINKTINHALRDLHGIGWRNEEMWTKVSSRNGSELFSVTTCYFNMDRPRVYNVTLSGHGIQSESVDNLHLNIDHQQNEKVKHQFGIGVQPSDFEDRGILELEIKDPGKPYKSPKGASWNYMLLSVLDSESFNKERCWGFIDDLKLTLTNSDWFAHRAHSSLFQSIIRETGDPAVAVQALITRLYQMSYYDLLPDYDLRYPATMIRSVEKLMPARWVGLSTVLALVGLHFALVLTTMALFAILTSASALGNAWQAVAQLVSPQTEEIIKLADSLTDKEVKKRAKTTGSDRQVYSMSKSVESDRVEAQLRGRR
ncbi:hypothetical protein FGADI_10018 [Fusarium gaditjirri]|uniref:Uncharacterized protein n=1 Tax=Fusarium gaditjirri TaxID=282569 RepID=A0A8H4SYR2_9HYPO|nr:hypothetical protein FGADI_10018 [Fusarium gaditjirri]